jgi:hypothetical protein
MISVADEDKNESHIKWAGGRPFFACHGLPVVGIFGPNNNMCTYVT